MQLLNINQLYFFRMELGLYEVSSKYRLSSYNFIKRGNLLPKDGEKQSNLIILQEEIYYLYYANIFKDDNP